jgi:hypothetical protein
MKTDKKDPAKDPSVKTPTPPQVMDPSKPPVKPGKNKTGEDLGEDATMTEQEQAQQKQAPKEEL